MRRGFTLVELIVALTLTILLLSGLFSALGSGVRSWKKISRRAAARQVRLIVAERICADLREAALLSGSTSAEVVFRLGTEQVSYKLVDGKVKRNSAYLTTENEIEQLSFYYPGPRLAGVRLAGLSFEVFTRDR